MPFKLPWMQPKGQKVIAPFGKYINSTIFLKSNTVLEVQAAVTIFDTPNLEDYVEMTLEHNKDRQPYHLNMARNMENIGVRG